MAVVFRPFRIYPTEIYVNFSNIKLMTWHVQCTHIYLLYRIEMILDLTCILKHVDN